MKALALALRQHRGVLFLALGVAGSTTYLACGGSDREFGNGAGGTAGAAAGSSGAGATGGSSGGSGARGGSGGATGGSGGATGGSGGATGGTGPGGTGPGGAGGTTDASQDRVEDDSPSSNG